MTAAGGSGGLSAWLSYTRLTGYKLVQSDNSQGSGWDTLVGCFVRLGRYGTVPMGRDAMDEMGRVCDACDASDAVTGALV